MDGADDPGSVGDSRVDCDGHTDMRRGMNSLALSVQEAFSPNRAGT